MVDHQRQQQRIVIVANRLPIVLMQGTDGDWSAEAAAGGLVNALRPMLKARGGLWIGWPGVVTEDQVPDLDGLIAAAAADVGYDLAAVPLSAHQRDAFYLGFSNEIIWPLFHDLQTRCNFDPDYWAAYEQVNRLFARTIVQRTQPNDVIWVHDYHLMNVAQELRVKGCTLCLSFFLHIPFPPLDIFLKLPWRMAILQALLSYDAVGVQTRRDRDNFVACVRALLPDLPINETEQQVTFAIRGRSVTVGNFPISIDAAELARQSTSDEVNALAVKIRRALPDQHLLLGVDRLDYTKGIPEKLMGFRAALQRYPELCGRITLTQVAVPSRTDIRQYSDLRTEIERLVGEINGEFTQPGWVPIHYITRRLSFSELLAYYVIADTALITPVKDGMNLVAKEYVICNGGEGVLVLSEFAGAADQLGDGALLCNPYDRSGVADTIHYAANLPTSERRARINRLRQNIMEHDIFWWVDAFLSTVHNHGSEQHAVQLVD